MDTMIEHKMSLTEKLPYIDFGLRIGIKNNTMIQ